MRKPLTPAVSGISLFSNPRNLAICKVETTKDIVDGLVDFYNLVFYFI